MCDSSEDEPRECGGCGHPEIVEECGCLEEFEDQCQRCFLWFCQDCPTRTIEVTRGGLDCLEQVCEECVPVNCTDCQTSTATTFCPSRRCGGFCEACWVIHMEGNRGALGLEE